ncbi:hypothetical protein BO99DRAFT_344734, partial [Aspergillus violaceofuscus CBS 115571]
KRDRTATTNPVLYKKIKELFFQQSLSKSELYLVLQEEGYPILKRTFKRICTILGLIRRTDDLLEQQL